MVEVRQSNPKAFEELETKLKELDGVQTKVGWFDSAKYEDGTPVAKVAFWQEHGVASRSIPPRPFMRPTILKKTNEWFQTAGVFANRVLQGKMTGQEAMTALGEVAQGDIIQTISEVNSPPLSNLTLAIRKWKRLNPEKKIGGRIIGMLAAKLKKGEIDLSGVSTKPLNDTGVMIGTITSETETIK